MDEELAELSGKVDSLIEHVRALRAANAELRRELAGAHEANRAMRERMQAATGRLDTLLARIPVE